ncbi:WD40 repeat-like protein [Mycena sanguinolenta]|uniref:WD40 repeat-like protein n=1 Tax=Mycena sanguinolenta TaxID=230812 RepID=A0A8H6ZAY4_9AGAR|nr:WD40 repeat-like protein [Mycena sanguinolenta]
MEKAIDRSDKVDGTQIHIGAVYGGSGGSGGSGGHGGTGGIGQGPNFSAGVMHVNNNIYRASRQAHTMLLPWFAPKALFNADTFAGASWANSANSSPILWLSGMAGTGKSTIAYTLCEDWSAEHRLGASFFCSRNDEKARSRISVIPTIAQQLLLCSKAFAHSIENAPIDIVIPASSQHVERLLVQPWSIAIASQAEEKIQTKGLVVVIDALDEIENDQGAELITQLIRAVSSSKGLYGLKFLVTSRPHPRIIAECSSIDEKAVYHMEDIDPKEASQDVRHFLDAELADLPSWRRENIVAESGGLFIYASTIEVEMSKRVLYCVVTTRQPLRISDLAALVIDATEEADHEAVHNALKSFHAVLYISLRDQCIYTFHKSFPDFILNPNRSPELAHPARSYFADRTHEDDKDLPERVVTNIGSELCYACQYWAAHLISVHDPQDVQQLSVALLEFCSLKVLFWMEAMNLLKLDCRLALYQAHNWVLLIPNTELNLSMAASQRLWASFVQGQAVKSTPHLYISSLATELATAPDCIALARWKKQFAMLPSVRCRGIMQQRGSMTYKHSSLVLVVAISPTGRHIISGLNDSTLQVWDVVIGVELIKLEGHSGKVNSVAFSPDSAQIVSGSDDKTVRIWDAITGNEVSKMEGHSGEVNSVAFSPNGAQIVSGSDDKTVRIWDAMTGNEMVKIEGHTDAIWSVAFSPNGAQIVSGSDDKTVWIWDAATGKEVTKIERHTGGVRSVAFSFNSEQLVSGSRDKTVRIWDATTGNRATMMGLWLYQEDGWNFTPPFLPLPAFISSLP